MSTTVYYRLADGTKGSFKLPCGLEEAVIATTNELLDEHGTSLKFTLYKAEMEEQ